MFLDCHSACAPSATALVYKIKLVNDRHIVALLRSRYSPVRPTFLSMLFHLTMLVPSSIVEINVANKVACMPACASCLRYLCSKIRSFIDMYFKNRMKPPTPKKANESQGSRDPNLGQTATSWPLRNWIGNGSDPPQNTAVMQRSGQAGSSGSLPIVEGELAYMDDKPSRKESISVSEGDQRPMRQDDLV